MLVLALISNGMPAHATVDGLNPMPLLSAGTKLWLSATATVSNRCGVVGESLLGRSFSVRDRQGGTLLFGAATNQFDAPASPVQVGAGTPICTAEGINPDGCSPGSTVTYSSVILAGDTPVVARDSEAATVSLDGVAYDVRVTAQQRTGGTVTCADYCGFGGVALDVQATHLTDLIAGLEVGAPPACGQGNDPERDLFFGLYGVPLGSTYEGSVTYKGRYASDPTEYDFAAAGLVGTAGAPTGLEIGGAEQLLPEPAVGQSFWLSYPSFRTQALRVAEQGPLLLAEHADASGDGGLRPDGAAPLAALLGISITLEQACAYTTSSGLWDVLFGTSPAVRVASGTIGTIPIGGRSYHAWVWGEGFLRISIYPAN